MLIADEDTHAAKILRTACDQLAGIKVAGSIVSPEMLMARLRRKDIDLLILDLAGDMGKNNIIDQIKGINPLQTIVIVFPSQVNTPDVLIAALEKGVHDCIEKPVALNSRSFNEFRIRIGTVAGIIANRKRFGHYGTTEYKNRFFIPVEPEFKTELSSISRAFKQVEIIVVASSTGGPEILGHVFGLLPKNFRVPILVVQHMPSQMTSFFANSLNMKSELDIVQAQEGDLVVPSTIYIAPGGRHMTVSIKDDQGRRFIRLSDTPPVNSVRPSADVLFKSVASSYDGNILAVILTGMGRDGRDGVKEMKKKGCVCLTQTAETCAVYGMPRAVDEAGLSDARLDPLSLTQKIVQAAFDKMFQI